MIELIGTVFTLLVLIIGMVQIAKLFPARLSTRQKKCWHLAHVVFVIIYFSGVVGALLLTSLATTVVTDHEQIRAAHMFARYFDWFLIIPGAIGCIISGVWISLRTSWGLFKYYWIMIKTLGNITAVLFGSTLVRIWFEEPINLTAAGQINPLDNPAYLHSHTMLLVGTIISLAILISLLLISYIKPWGKRLSKAAAADL